VFDGKPVIYEFSELNEIVLSYAASVHKFQGSESPCIVMPIHTSHYMLLQRNLLYTGITRAKKLVVLLGTKQAIALAIKNDKVEKRHTGLSYFLGNQ
jgi:exodeoxyribonuclease V alpha subunit